MTTADKAKLLALADEWKRRERRDERRGMDYYAGSANAYANVADELRALVAEMGDGDGK